MGRSRKEIIHRDYELKSNPLTSISNNPRKDLT